MKGHDWAAIRQAYPIVTVAGAVTKLRKAGKNFTGCCPFHNEKTPSFYVYPDSESFHCFGCSAHGDVVDFVALNDGVDTKTALARLTGGQDIRMTDERRAEHEAAMTEREAQTAAERKAATAKAFDRWRKSQPYNDEAPHAYIAKKRIERHTARLEGENLILPVYDADGVLQNVQTISATGKKLFHTGAPMAGGRLLIGINMGPIIVAEGFATGATLHEACADQVCVTFSMGNMREVATQLHAAGHQIILAPDAGACAEMCAKLGEELGVPVAVPVTTDKGDFNDMASEVGHDAVAAVILKAVRSFAAAKQADAEDEQAESAPTDLWAKPSPPDFPVGILPKIIEDFSIVRAEQMGVDPGGLAMSALASCATVIRDEIQVKVKRHELWTESARLWVMLIGEPSYKKSPMMRAATGRIKKLDADMLYANNKALADWQEDGGSKGDRPKPSEPRLRVEDITMEACQEVARHSPDGILALQDELSGWFGGIEKYAGGKGGAKDRAFWLQAFNGGQYAVNRVGRGSFLIDNLSVSILGGVQPDPIRRIVGDASDDGLIQRFLPVVLRPAKLGKDEESSTVAADFDLFLECLHELRAPDSVLGPLALQFDDGARRIREELEAKHHAMVQRIEGYNRKLAAHIGKFDGLFPRLCIIWHCADHVAANPADPLPVTISTATAAKVEKFLHDYIMKHSLAFYLGVIGLADDHDQLCDVGGYILAHKLENVTMRTLQRGSRQMRKITREEGAKIFEQLEAFGWLEQVSKRSDTPAWKVNPDVHVLFADRGKAEKAKRNEIRSEIAEMTGA
jgi:phage/plasmid primase-like uncharacterized protein